MANQEPEYFTTEELAGRFRRPVSTLRYWRHCGWGPKGVRMGRRVVYPRAEVERFERQLAEEAGATSAATA